MNKIWVCPYCENEVDGPDVMCCNEVHAEERDGCNGNCYQIGGRFIAEDPDCPLHGRH